MLFLRTFFFVTSVFVFGFSCVAGADPLPSWKDRPAKRAIMRFVERVTQADSPDFVPVPERVAVFDNDGTLWCENPMPFQLAYALDVLRERVASEPKLKEDAMVQAALAGDFSKLLAGKHHDGLMKIASLTHAGMTTDQFNDSVRDWIRSAKHPRFSRRYAECVYQPMLELLVYLRNNGFKTYIVSGGGADFMRVWSEEVYGIPPEQVVGTTARPRFEVRGDRAVLVRTFDDLFVDDKEGKPVGIHQFIGRRPIACFGNSDGDQAMLEYTTLGNPRPSLGVIVHHTDGEREYAYDSNPKSSGNLATALRAAGDRNWSVVDMKKDWATIFPE